MANAEWEKLKKALQKPTTPEAMEEAAKAFKKYQQVKLAKGKGSKPTLVSLGFKKDYPAAVDVNDIADELARNPAFFEHMREIVEEK